MDAPDDPLNQAAQACSHFTFERSRGNFLVNDLQGVGNLLTDPAIQTRDKNKFKLHCTNLNEHGFKFFFTSHEYNRICRKLRLKSNREMLISGKYEFRSVGRLWMRRYAAPTSCVVGSSAWPTRMRWTNSRATDGVDYAGHSCNRP